MIRAITFKKNEEMICWNLIQTAVLHMYLLFYEWIKVSGLNLVYSERTTLFRCETLMEVSGNLDSRVAYKWYLTNIHSSYEKDRNISWSVTEQILQGHHIWTR